MSDWIAEVATRSLPHPVRRGDSPRVKDVLSKYALSNDELEAMQARLDLGETRYCTPLYVSNGRDALVDIIQELADASVYAVQYAEASRPEGGGWPEDRSAMELAYKIFELLGDSLEEWRRREDAHLRLPPSDRGTTVGGG